MGSGGMVGAEFAATIGVRTAVVERARVGGDCLWTGCVPSKALLASAKAAHVMRTADKYGLPSVVPEVDTELVWKRIRAIQHDVASTDDDPKRYEDMGIDILRGTARLTGPNTLDVDGRTVETRYVLLCTGSRPAVPGIEGLAGTGFITSENLFELERAPESTVMIGGGPIAIEMAQAFTRLGIRTTVLQKGSEILPRDEPELVQILTARLIDEGVDLRLDVDTERVTVDAGSKTVHGRELAHAGLTIAEARARFGDDVDAWHLDLAHSDRARADSATEGSIIIVTAKRQKIVGAHILAPSAGEMIHELALAITEELKLNQVAALIHVYPTLC